tara:strand:+ start:2098 stop:2856 length:759 start_codon:yes stop_codon:yes gene_type:complete
MRFEGKTALITGAGRGIGLAVAHELARGGADLALNDLDGERLKASAAALREHGAKVSMHVGSVTDEGVADRMVSEAVAEHRKIDLLVNNAGGGPVATPWQAFSKTPTSDLRAFFELNFFSQATLLHLVLPDMVDRGYGKIVCVSSISAILGQENGAPYAAAKAALHGLVSSVSKEVARHGVTINAVVLGNPPHPSRTPDRQDYLNHLSHFDRVGRFEEFGKAIAFLLSDDSSYISGAAVPIDGGILAPRLNE